MKLSIYIYLAFFIVVAYKAKAQNAGEMQIKVTQASQPVFIGNKPWVYAELTVTNNSDDAVVVNSITVSDSKFASLLNIAGDAVLKLSNHNSRTVQPKSRALFYLETPLAKTVKVSQLIYRVNFSKQGSEPRLISVTKALNAKKPIMLNPPLKGVNWAAVYDPAWARGHRRVYFAIDKQPKIPGRFAIDFIKLNDRGQYAPAEEDSIATWYGYGQDVLAVSDGLVVSAVDTFAESRTLSAHPKYDSTKATGNYISIKIQDSVYAFYEHLKPGSIKVKAGDRVKAGQVIGNVGFTGQTTGPHLHFHLANRNSALGAEGIPYGFRSFVTQGFYKDFDDFGKKRWEPTLISHKGSAESGRPASNSVVDFSDRQDKKR